MAGAICGGVIPLSKFTKDPYAYMMAFVMPDEHYDKYIELKKAGKAKEATAIFDKYARSNI